MDGSLDELGLYALDVPLDTPAEEGGCLLTGCAIAVAAYVAFVLMIAGVVALTGVVF